jgi:hypothetical protein
MVTFIGLDGRIVVTRGEEHRELFGGYSAEVQFEMLKSSGWMVVMVV